MNSTLAVVMAVMMAAPHSGSFPQDGYWVYPSLFLFTYGDRQLRVSELSAASLNSD